MATRGDLALVMGGGGARAAYQVGVLRAVARHVPELRLPFLTGVSAGAINAAHLAAHPGPFVDAVESLEQLWSHLAVEDVFRVDAPSLVRQLVRTSAALVSGGFKGAPQVRGLVDTSPLRRFLMRALAASANEIPGITRNLDEGRLRALALSTSSYTTGQSVVWIQGSEIHAWERPLRRARSARITVDHVMASAALPLFFPAVQLEDGWYGDGGIRLAAPLSPALHLGADRILAISTRYGRTRDEAARAEIAGYPPPAQIAGVLMNAIFLDLLDQDALRLERINDLLARLPEPERQGLRPVRLLVIRPSQDLGRLAGRFEPRLPTAFRFLTRGLGTRRTESPDFLSLILFQPDYLRELMRIGEADGEARADEIAAFLGNDSGD